MNILRNKNSKRSGKEKKRGRVDGKEDVIIEIEEKKRKKIVTREGEKRSNIKKVEGAIRNKGREREKETEGIGKGKEEKGRHLEIFSWSEGKTKVEETKRRSREIKGRGRKEEEKRGREKSQR